MPLTLHLERAPTLLGESLSRPSKWPHAISEMQQFIKDCRASLALDASRTHTTHGNTFAAEKD
jgi:hypothetical protein